MNNGIRVVSVLPTRTPGHRLSPRPPAPPQATAAQPPAAFSPDRLAPLHSEAEGKSARGNGGRCGATAPVSVGLSSSYLS